MDILHYRPSVPELTAFSGLLLALGISGAALHARGLHSPQEVSSQAVVKPKVLTPLASGVMIETGNPYPYAAQISLEVATRDLEEKLNIPPNELDTPQKVSRLYRLYGTENPALARIKACGQALLPGDMMRIANISGGNAFEIKKDYEAQICPDYPKSVTNSWKTGQGLRIA